MSVPTFSKTALGVTVTDLATAAQTAAGSGGDGTAYSITNAIWDTASSLITEAGQALTDVADVSASEIANALWRPYYQSLMSYFNDVPAATGVLNTDAGSVLLPGGSGVTVGDLVAAAVDSNPTPSFTDPLLLDLTGGGIGVSSWIRSPVYFDTNVKADANGNPTTTPDGMEHETAWMQAGTGMLVFESGGVVAPITNITQTVSEFLNAGTTPGKYADGLAALAALTQAGATAFTAQTALIDPTTGVSYWNEIMVWNDANANGVSDAGEVVSLDSLGITSISLVGSGATDTAREWEIWPFKRAA
ncbi:hypothetical protein CWS72_27205 [Telmatospirillum siberiense]|uniref:Uncharacterized protein n=1 Tax=Telmatospirillum siberiense TaxID=382514 RepID=A0A2N3PLT3_9PROT|nr:hypothetical protein CWS72_27205 [Telmatospirillum siberiense]